ncbi:hypothetical protein [Aureibaculum conchae]|uniref:hypothetical protein n=1 Tax=Aureibaculum sp. 2308TA14-22 TaxID=3108392 RepID=UPI00339385F4
MSGHFNAFKKRQKSNESHKSSLRNKIRTKKKHLVEDSNYAKDEFDLPDVSKTELEQIKEEIRTKIQKEKRTRFIITLVVTMVILTVIIFLIRNIF